MASTSPVAYEHIVSPSPESIPETGHDKATGATVNLSHLYFRYTYTIENRKSEKKELENWLDQVLQIALMRTRFRDQEIIIYNGDIIEDFISHILVDHSVHRIFEIGGAYIITLVSHTHESGREVGEVVRMKVLSTLRSSAKMEGDDFRLLSLIRTVGAAGNILNCTHVSELNDAVKEFTGYSATTILEKLNNQFTFAKQPDMSYWPRYLLFLRQMQGLAPFPTFLGEIHYSDSAIKGMLHCAMQIDGSDLQSDYVVAVEIKLEDYTNILSEVQFSIYDCGIEELIRISQNDTFERDQKTAVLQTELLKSQRRYCDIQCLTDLFMNPPQSVEQLQQLADKFRARAHEYWKHTVCSYTYEPFRADESFRRRLVHMMADYRLVPTFDNDLSANVRYYRDKISQIQWDLAGVQTMDLDVRRLLTTKAILTNRTTFILRQETEFSLEKFVAGNRVDGDEWHFPIRAMTGIFLAGTSPEDYVIVKRHELWILYTSLTETSNEVGAIGPIGIKKDMILPHLYGTFAHQRFPKDTQRNARKKLDEEFEQNQGVIHVDKIAADYLTNRALAAICGEVGSDPNFSSVLLPADSTRQVERYTPAQTNSVMPVLLLPQALLIAPVEDGEVKKREKLCSKASMVLREQYKWPSLLF